MAIRRTGTAQETVRWRLADLVAMWSSQMLVKLFGLCDGRAGVGLSAQLSLAWLRPMPHHPLVAHPSTNRVRLRLDFHLSGPHPVLALALCSRRVCNELVTHPGVPCASCPDMAPLPRQHRRDCESRHRNVLRIYPLPTTAAWPHFRPRAAQQRSGLDDTKLAWWLADSRLPALV